MARNKTYLYGKNSVTERLKADPKSIRQVFIQDNFNAPQIIDLIKSKKIPLKTLNESSLLKVKKADRLQGIVAETDSYQYIPLEKMLRKGLDEQLSLVFLDSLNDPHNLGSIMRTAACFSKFGLVIPEHGSCSVNDTVIHVASGGENFVPVSMVTNMTNALLKAKTAGYWVVGTVVEGGENINRLSLPFPLCLVLGTEGKGIRYGIHKHLDLKTTLPMKGVQLSLNVAMAFAIFAHEISRQKGG